MAGEKMAYFSSLGVGKETVWGTKVAPTLHLPIRSETIDLKKNLIQRPGVRKKRGRTQPVLGGWRSDGDIVFEVDPDNIGLITGMALGSESAVTTLSTSAAFRHQFKLASVSLPSFTVEIDKQAKTFQDGGNIINRYVLSYQPNEILLATVGVVSKGNQVSSSTTTATYSTKLPFHYGMTSSISIGGSANALVRDWEITLENNLVVEKPTVADSLYITEPDLGQAKVTGRATLYFNNANEYERFWGTVGDTAPGTSLTTFAISCSIQHTTAIGATVYPYRLAAICPAATYTSAPANISDPEGPIQQTITWEAFEGSAASYNDLVVEVDDAQAGVYI